MSAVCKTLANISGIWRHMVREYNPLFVNLCPSPLESVEVQSPVGYSSQFDITFFPEWDFHFLLVNVKVSNIRADHGLPELILPWRAGWSSVFAVFQNHPGEGRAWKTAPAPPTLLQSLLQLGQAWSPIWKQQLCATCFWQGHWKTGCLLHDEHLSCFLFSIFFST